MKRKNSLYQSICNIDNISTCFNEVCRNTRNENRVIKAKEYKAMYIFKIQQTLLNKSYVVGPYTKFVLYEPKKRNIVSQNITDKIVTI